MRETADFVPNARTWREIPQEVKSRAMSRQGRTRFMRSGAKTAGAIAALVAVAWLTYTIVATCRTEPKKMAAAMNTVPVKAIEPVTDGVLDRAWVTRTLNLPKNATLMELDLHRLQQQLLESGQVRSAVLTKTFPSTLAITLAERSPVARVMAQTADEPPRELLVARDGVVFAGVGFETAMLQTLPWLAGVKLVRQGQGFAPIEAMDTVADLLAKARNEAPQLYETWRVVDLSRLARDGEIEVRSTEIDKIIFSTSFDFFVQIARLDFARDQAGPRMKTVNLGLGPQVVVTYDGLAAMEKPVALAVPARSPERSRFVLPAFFNPQRSKPHRDL